MEELEEEGERDERMSAGEKERQKQKRGDLRKGRVEERRERTEENGARD